MYLYISQVFHCLVDCWFFSLYNTNRQEITRRYELLVKYVTNSMYSKIVKIIGTLNEFSKERERERDTLNR